MPISARITYLTVYEAAAILRITPNAVILLCRSGDLKATKPGKQWLIAEADLVAYLESSSNTPAPEAS